MKSLYNHQKAILAAGVLSIIAWAVPVLSLGLLPLTYLNTLIHEICHALAGIGTGAQVTEILVHADGSGVTPMLGGNLWLIGPAGYVGSALVGAAIIWASRTPKGAQLTLRILAVLLAVAMILWVRGDIVGVVAGLGWLATLVMIPKFVKNEGLLFVAQFIGLQQCLNSVKAITTLINISAAAPDAHSDALIMQENSHIPAIVWAIGWCVFSLMVVAVSLRRSWTEVPRRPVAGPG